MDNRIEAFLQDVLAFEGEISQSIRDGVRRYLVIYEKQFRDAEPNKRMKDSHCGKSYSDDRGYCRYFIEPRGNSELGQCERVSGPINRLYWCRLLCACSTGH